MSDNDEGAEFNKFKVIQVDVTHHAKNLANIINKINLKRNTCPYATTNYIFDLYTGSKRCAIINSGDIYFEEAGKCTEFNDANQLQPILTQMEKNKIIIERKKRTQHGSVIYWEPDSQILDFINFGEPKIFIKNIF